MERRFFILTTLAAWHTHAFSKVKSIIHLIADKRFKVGAGEARFGTRYKMKGVTQNILDIKISGKDTKNELAVCPAESFYIHYHSDLD